MVTIVLNVLDNRRFFIIRSGRKMLVESMCGAKS